MIEAAVFFLLAALALVGAIGVVTSRSVFVSALWLVASLVGVAGLYIVLDASFLGVVQILIYVGAIAVLILFAIMLTRNLMVTDSQQSSRMFLAAALSLAVFAMLATVASRGAWPVTSGSVLPADGGVGAQGGAMTDYEAVPGAAVSPGEEARAIVEIPGPVAMLGASLVTQYLLEFELVSLILLVALIGAVIVARQ